MVEKRSQILSNHSGKNGNFEPIWFLINCVLLRREHENVNKLKFTNSFVSNTPLINFTFQTELKFIFRDSFTLLIGYQWTVTVCIYNFTSFSFWPLNEFANIKIKLLWKFSICSEIMWHLNFQLFNNSEKETLKFLYWKL